MYILTDHTTGSIITDTADKLLTYVLDFASSRYVISIGGDWELTQTNGIGVHNLSTDRVLSLLRPMTEWATRN